MTKVYVVGSINTDRAFNVARIARPGETVSAHSCSESLGGKGANQAIAAARAGAAVSLIACVGMDAAGDRALSELNTHGVDTSGVHRVDAPTGSAMIQVDTNGENSIAVCSGANLKLSPHRVAASLVTLQSSDIVLCQGEVPPAAIAAASLETRRTSASLIVNVSPVFNLDIPRVAPRWLIVNEHEARHLSGPGGFREWAEGLASRGTFVVVTQGPSGAILFNDSVRHVPAINASQVVDTTGAGDAFVGAFASSLASGSTAMFAGAIAAAAASICVAHRGAHVGEYDAATLHSLATGKATE